VKSVFTVHPVNSASKPEFYEQVNSQLSHLISDERNELANLSNCAALLGGALSDINWVGFYLWYEAEQQLILGPFQGKPACIRIAPGRGVCGTAVEQQQTQVVEDVFAFPGHIACDPDSRSEIVIPIIQAGRVIGVLDIDSPSPNRFNAEDAKGLEKLVDILLGGTDFAIR
jgi:L-methionine (R)-S-oxide reductase